MADKTWLDVVKAKESEDSDLTNRMDDDRDWRNLKTYTMMTLDGKKEMKNISSVTLPEPPLFMAKTIAKIAQAERQPYILADKKTMSDAFTTKIEEFIEDMEYEIDSLLNEKGERSAKDFNADIVCSRGRVAEQIVTRRKDGEYIPDVRPLDTRYFRYQAGPNGMLWGCAYSWRDKEWLEEIYPEEMLNLGGVSSEEDILVRDLWTKKRKGVEAENIIYLDDKQLKRSFSKKVLGYDIDYPPFVVQVVPSGSVQKDKGNLKYSGESVFEMLRAVFDEDNFIASTLKTLNYSLFKPPLQIATKDGKPATLPDDYPGDPGAVTGVDMPGAIQPVFSPDIKAFTARYDSKIRTIMDKAGYSSVDYGQVTGAMSFIAMTLLAQGKRELLLPRLKALTLLYEARYRMIIKQLLAIGQTVELGELGHRRSYSPKQLEGEYKVKFRFFPNTKDELAANAALAQSMGDDVSEDYKRREIYKLPDPDGEKEKIDAERAEAGSRIIQLINQGRSLIKQERDLEARAVLIELKMLIKQKKMAILSPEEEEPVVKRKRTRDPLSLFTGGSGLAPDRE